MFKKIYIEITNECNLKCKFCSITNREKRYMKTEEFENIIKKIQNYTKIVCLHVKGEPLLHPNLNEFLMILDKYNIKVNITTNGTLLKRNLHILKEVKCVRQLNISLHSLIQNKEINKNYLDDIFKCVEQIPNIIVSYRLWNLKSISENNENLEIISKIQKFYDIKELKEILSNNEYYKIKDNIFINQDLEFVWPNLNGKIIINKGRCLAIKEQIAILVDGNVVPCCLDGNGDIILGNIFKESLENILNKEIAKNIYLNFSKNIIICNLCKTCGFLKRLEDKRKK